MVFLQYVLPTYIELDIDDLPLFSISGRQLPQQLQQQQPLNQF